MGLFSMIKHNSKLALKQNWGRAVIILLIIYGVAALISILQQIALTVFVLGPMLSNPPMEPPPDIGFREAFLWAMAHIPSAEWIIIGVSTVLSILLVAPLSLGIARWYFNLVHGRSMPITEVFHYYETGKAYWRSIWCEINVGFRTMLWSLLFYMIPGGMFITSVYYLSGDHENSRALTAIATTGLFLSVILFLLATLFYAVCVSRYTLVAFLLGEDDQLSVGKAIQTSVAYTKGFRFSLVWFGLSYIGWFLLTIFLIPIFYVIPYYATGIAMYSRFIIEKNRYEAPSATKEFSSLPETEAAE